MIRWSGTPRRRKGERLLIDDMTPAKTAGLLLMAALMWGSLIVNSFFNDDSPIQVRVLNCHVAHSTTRQCPATLVWVGF